MLEPVHPTDLFERDVKELRKVYPRINEVRRALMWELARNSEAGEELRKRPGYWILLTYPIGSMPPFRVLYKFSQDNPDTVMLLRIAPSTTEEF